MKAEDVFGDKPAEATEPPKISNAECESGYCDIRIGYFKFLYLLKSFNAVS